MSAIENVGSRWFGLPCPPGRKTKGGHTSTPMRRNLAFWKTKLANAEKEVAALQGVVGPSEMTVLPSMSFSICFSRTPSLVKKRWLTWLRCRRIQRKARARLAMLLTTKLPTTRSRSLGVRHARPSTLSKRGSTRDLGFHGHQDKTLSRSRYVRR